MKLDGEAAFAAAAKNPAHRYPGRGDPRVLSGTLVVPALTPGFRIGAGDTVFTAGSCLARDVERPLLAEGVNVPTARFVVPPDELAGVPGGMLDRHTPATLLQWLEAAEAPVDDRGLYPAGEGRVVDALQSTGARPVPRARALERRAEIAALCRDALRTADACIVTLGSVEGWYDRDARVFLTEAPPRRTALAAPGRFEVRRPGIGECRDLVFALLDRLVGPAGRPVILTVSPVPQRATFTGGDALVANGQSKALLRVLAGEAAEAFPSVDYFPALEIVGSAGHGAHDADNVRLRPEVVERLVSLLLTTYCRC